MILFICVVRVGGRFVGLVCRVWIVVFSEDKVGSSSLSCMCSLCVMWMRLVLLVL